MTATTLVEHLRGLLARIEEQTDGYPDTADAFIRGMDAGTRSTCEAIRAQLDGLARQAAEMQFRCRRCGVETWSPVGPMMTGDRVCSRCAVEHYDLRHEQGRQSWEEEQREMRDEPVS